MNKVKSLCESCSNRVYIEYRIDSSDKVRKHESDCFYNFKVWTVVQGQYGDYHVSNLIVDKCSFYNKTAILFKHSEEAVESDDSDDNNSSKSKTSGVTFVNIPGALLP